MGRSIFARAQLIVLHLSADTLALTRDNTCTVKFGAKKNVKQGDPQMTSMKDKYITYMVCWTFSNLVHYDGRGRCCRADSTGMGRQGHGRNPEQGRHADPGPWLRLDHRLAGQRHLRKQLHDLDRLHVRQCADRSCAGRFARGRSGQRLGSQRGRHDLAVQPAPRRRIPQRQDADAG